MDSKPYELGMNCAGETAGQVANHLVADLRVYLNPGGAALCDVLSGNIFSAIRESASAALAQRDAEVARLRALLRKVCKRWTFNNDQQHTHTWHDWAAVVPHIEAALAEAPRHE